MDLAKGTRDFSCQEKILRDKVTNTITQVFARYGYNPIETPIIERLETLTAKYGASDETDVAKEIYQLQDQGGRKLGLRFDLTVPAARFVAMNPQLKMPFKRYQIGNVYRDGPIKLGRYREFVQCDFDVFGCKALRADAEILSVFFAVFKELDTDVVIEVNNRKLLSELIKQSGVKEKDVESVMITIDKIDKLGKEAVSKELAQKNISEDATTKLLELFTITGSNEEKLAVAQKLVSKDSEGLQELREVLMYEPRATINLGLARGLAYYTGTVFEGRIKDSTITSSVCAGGRYDTLIGTLLGNNKSVPAVGGSFGLEPITEYLKERAKGEPQGYPKTQTQAFVIPIKCYEQALPLVKKLRDAGVNTEIDLMERGISKNLEYANAQDIPYVIILGQKELSEGVVKKKDMRSGEETTISPEQLIKELS